MRMSVEARILIAIVLLLPERTYIFLLLRVVQQSPLQFVESLKIPVIYLRHT